MTSRTSEEKKVIGDALGEGLIENLIELLGQVPRVILLILKTNDLSKFFFRRHLDVLRQAAFADICSSARSLDEGLHTRQGPVRTFLILARYASRTVYEECLENLSGSLLWPRNFVLWFAAWTRFMRVEMQLSGYETYLKLRALLGMSQMEIGDSFRE